MLRYNFQTQRKITAPISNDGEYSLKLFGEDYECVGILEHVGSETLNGGHYNFVALAPPYSVTKQAWLCSDSTNPRRINPPKVQDIFEGGYMTVWEKTQKGENRVSPNAVALTGTTTSRSQAPIITTPASTTSLREIVAAAIVEAEAAIAATTEQETISAAAPKPIWPTTGKFKFKRILTSTTMHTANTALTTATTITTTTTVTTTTTATTKTITTATITKTETST